VYMLSGEDIVKTIGLKLLPIEEEQEAHALQVCLCVYMHIFGM